MDTVTLYREAQKLDVDTRGLCVSEVLLKLRHFPAGNALRMEYLKGN